jgi:hypothetical protein
MDIPDGAIHRDALLKISMIDSSIDLYPFEIKNIKTETRLVKNKITVRLTGKSLMTGSLEITLSVKPSSSI